MYTTVPSFVLYDAGIKPRTLLENVTFINSLVYFINSNSFKNLKYSSQRNCEHGHDAGYSS